MTIDLSRLAAKQKRVKDWADYLPNIQDAGVRSDTESALSELRALLATCWHTGSFNQDQEQCVIDLERRLEQLNEEARLRVVGRTQARTSRG